MHALWQALQPMHFEMSISLATLAVSRTPGGGVVVADRCLMSRDCRAIRVSSNLFHVHQERLEFRRVGVGVADKGRERVGEVARPGDALEAPVDRNAYGVDFPTLHLERAQAL